MCLVVTLEFKTKSRKIQMRNFNRKGHSNFLKYTQQSVPEK